MCIPPSHLSGPNVARLECSSLRSSQLGPDLAMLLKPSFRTAAAPPNTGEAVHHEQRPHPQRLSGHFQSLAILSLLILLSLYLLKAHCGCLP